MSFRCPHPQLTFLLFFLVSAASLETLPGFQNNIGSFSILGGNPEQILFLEEDVTFLPVGSSTGSILEYWYLPSVVTNLDKGGFAATEPLTVNTHGGSAFWQKYWLEDMDISDPLDRGKPFVDIPVKAWKSFSVNSLLGNYGNAKGYRWSMLPKIKNGQTDEMLFPVKYPHIKTNLAFTSLMGGDSLIARGLFDREPAQLWGAPEERRHFLPSYEVNLKYEGLGLLSQPAIGFTEGLFHNRSFPQTQGSGAENNYRISSAWAQKASLGHSAFLLYQGRMREYAGIEKTQALGTSLKESQHNLVLLFQSAFTEQNHWNYHAGLGLGLGDETIHQNDIYLSIQDEVIRGTPELPRRHQTFFLDAALKNQEIFLREDFFKTSIGVSSPLRFELTSQKYAPEGQRLVRTDEGSPLDVFLHDPHKNQIDMLFRLRPKVFSNSKLNSFTLDAELGFLSENIFSQSGSGFYRISPTALIKLTYEKNLTAVESTGADNAPGLKFILGLQHEAIPSTLEESEFLNPNSVSGRRERWIDQNNDGRYQTGEEAGALYRSGGAYHKVGSGLKHPVMEEVFLGGIYKFFQNWQTALNLSGKWYRNLYGVDYAPEFLPGYREVERNDVRGGLLYDRSPGSYGEEEYILTNREGDSFFVGIEFQILKEAIASWWFFNITIGAYAHLASNLVGNGVSYNDIAQYSEASADPNNRLNLFARTDYDRAYIVNFLFGFYLWEGLIWTNTIHYRDGIPFGEFIIARGLSQGSIPVMNSERGGGLRGVGRYTFYLNWDIRLRYEYKRYSITFDIYNLLESSTETLENPFKGQARRPLDTTTPRSFRISLAYFWD